MRGRTGTRALITGMECDHSGVRERQSKSSTGLGQPAGPRSTYPPGLPYTQSALVVHRTTSVPTADRPPWPYRGAVSLLGSARSSRRGASADPVGCAHDIAAPGGPFGRTDLPPPTDQRDGPSAVDSTDQWLALIFAVLILY